MLFGGKKIDEQSNFEKLDWFAGELVFDHQMRSCIIAPTIAFKQAAPKTIAGRNHSAFWRLVTGVEGVVTINPKLLFRWTHIMELKFNVVVDRES
ncbi:hypothetical protein DVH24_020278 [Malus domestica]|uniref:Uncharacterized protein n=1 Tax=Malus domestica TaxID=3750 RepID=A0A498J8V4_MALDO|nr:hypothetical protein DVH24_020278 [Malus domestica]